MKEDKKEINLEWYYKIKKLNDEKTFLEELSKEEEKYYIDVYDIGYTKETKKQVTTFVRLEYDWSNIYGEESDYSEQEREELVKTAPNGMEHFYKKDKDKKSSEETYNWEYIVDLIEQVSGKEIYEIDESENSALVKDIISYMPSYVTMIMENINDFEKLAGELIQSYDELKTDIDCPKELKDNREFIYTLFNELSKNGIEEYECFDFMNDELKNDPELLKRILRLNPQFDHKQIINQLDKEILENDKELKSEYTRFLGINYINENWEEMKVDFEELIECMNYNEFMEFIENDNLTLNPNLAKRIEVEKEKREEEELDNCEYYEEDNGEAQSYDAYIRMRDSVKETIGKTQNVENELFTTINKEIDK